MADINELVRNFLAQKQIAVVGVSDNRSPRHLRPYSYYLTQPL